MLRAWTFCVVLLSLGASSVRPAVAHAENVDQAGPLSPKVELTLADEWVTRMAEARFRRQALEGWSLPIAIGGVTAIAGFVASTIDTEVPARAVLAASTAFGAAGTLATIMSEPEGKGPWFATGWAAMLTTYGAGMIMTTARRESCDGRCFNERAGPWLGGALLAQSFLFFPMAWIDRGPTPDDYREYYKLSPDQRVYRARRMLARQDQAQRQAAVINLIGGVAASLVFGAGAALVPVRSERARLLGLGGATLSLTGLMTMIELLKPTRLEQFDLGARPGTREPILW